MMKPVPMPTVAVQRKLYKLGENIRMSVVHTDYIQEAMPYCSDLKTTTIKDNTIVLIIEPDNKEKIIIHMTPDQAKAIRKGLKTIIKRLGGNK